MHNFDFIIPDIQQPHKFLQPNLKYFMYIFADIRPFILALTTPMRIA